MVHPVSKRASQVSHYALGTWQGYTANSNHTVVSSCTMQLVILTQQLHYKSLLWSNLYYRTFNPSLNTPLAQISK